MNFMKSRLFGVGIPSSDLHHMALIPGCCEGNFPFTYLGVPVGANMHVKKHWKPIVDKFKSKLSVWRASTLSFGGRLTLITSILGSLPTYFLSLLKAPEGIIDSLEKNQITVPWRRR